MRDRNIWLDGIMGVVVGDALGLPVQFSWREELEKDPVTDMVGYRTFDMPAGSWSDDSSLTLAALSSINELGRVDSEDIMNRFLQWYDDGAYTPYGFAYDIGCTCEEAICRYGESKNYKECGCTGEHSNGNGSLMRIMPICLYVYENIKKTNLTEKQGIELIHEVSALTHAHLRSKMACGIYYFMIESVLDNQGTLLERLQIGIDKAVTYYHKDIENLVQMAYYHRLMKLDKFLNTPASEIESSGYVVDSIEAAVWCLIQTDNLKDCLLKAVNLGRDTDTIAAIAGGIAGLYYGYGSIPESWLEKIQKREWIEEMCNRA